jgi:hypothetical protein
LKSSQLWLVPCALEAAAVAAVAALGLVGVWLHAVTRIDAPTAAANRARITSLNVLVFDDSVIPRMLPPEECDEGPPCRPLDRDGSPHGVNAGIPRQTGNPMCGGYNQP